MGDVFSSTVPDTIMFGPADQQQIPYPFLAWVEHIINRDEAFTRSVSGIAMGGRIINALQGKGPRDGFDWAITDASVYAGAVSRAAKRERGFVEFVTKGEDGKVSVTDNGVSNMTFLKYVAASIPPGFEEPEEP